MSTRADDPQPEYLVHHDLHSSWDQCRLVYWLLSFEPTYPRDELFRRIKSTMAEFGVASYLFYELLGNFDLLVRAWVPKSVLSSELTSNLEIVLEGLPLGARANLVELEVLEIVRHWLWLGPGRVRRNPDPEFVRKTFTREYLARLNATLDPSNSIKAMQLDAVQLRKALQDSVLLPYPDLKKAQEGIKFVMLVATEGLSSDQRGHLKWLIADGLDALSERQDSPGLEVATELALYYTPNNGVADFLVVGRLATDSFYPALQTLQDLIIAPPLQPMLRARPNTHVLARINFSHFQESLTAGQLDTKQSDDQIVDVRELLRQVERSDLEFKSSAYVDYAKWLRSGGDFESKETLFLEGIVRTVAAFLNSPPHGGTLVVGAWEKDAVIRSKSQLSEEGLERLSSLPEVGRCLITGIGGDVIAMRSAGRRINDADELCSHVVARLDSALEKVTAGRLESSLVTVEGRSVLSLRVRPSGPKRWAYFKDAEGHDDVFVVRSGGRTKRLTGRERDEYQGQWE